MTKKKKCMIPALLVLAAAVVMMARWARESEWEGLTESEARAKLDAKLPNRIPEEKRTRISDKLATKMRDQGIIVADDESSDESSA